MGLFDFLSPKPDHPLGGLVQARKVADELSRRDPRSAVDEAMAWLESLTAAESFRAGLLVERLLLIEGAAVPQVRRLAREYLNAPQGTTASNALWDVACRFWNQLGAAYSHVLGRYVAGGRNNKLSADQAAHVYAAALNAWAALQKWQQYRYRRVPDSFWEITGRLYLDASARELAGRRFELYEGYGQTSVEGEYLRILLFHVAAMDTLPPTEIEIGERLIAHFLPHFTLWSEQREGCAYWVDAAGRQAPARLVRVPPKRPDQRFFSGTQALAARDQLAEGLRRTGNVPADLVLGAQYPAPTVLHVLDHLGQSWSARPPVRDHVRRTVQEPLAVIHGFVEGMRTIAYAASSARTRIPDLELWAVSDVSLGGMAIHGTLGRNPWPCIGMLVTMKPDGGGNWLIGVVRRFSRNPAPGEEDIDAVLAADPNFASLGIETLSRSPAAVMGDADGLSVDIILLDLPAVGEVCRALVPPAAVEKTIPVTFTLNGQSGRMMPQATVETGPDYWLVNFFVQSFY